MKLMGSPASVRLDVLNSILHHDVGLSALCERDARARVTRLTKLSGSRHRTWISLSKAAIVASKYAE
jgi:hypothetical protein